MRLPRASTSSADRKAAIRRRIWQLLETRGIARFPRPVHGRIPNFVGAEAAAERLVALPAFANAQVVKVNPDAPQLPVRVRALQAGKRVVVPTPRLRGDFVLLDPARTSKDRYRAAASISGMFRLGRVVPLEQLPYVDLIVAGSVAVARDGNRIGKGEGYSELEYAVLRTLERIDPEAPICTTVHEAQLVEEIPQEPFDVPVDWIVTPERTYAAINRGARPPGILWEHLGRRWQEMPVLASLRARELSGPERRKP